MIRSSLHHISKDALRAPLASPFSQLTYSQIRLSPESPSQNAAVVFHRIPRPSLTSSGESLLSPPGELFPRCRSGWLPLAGGCTQPGAGGPAELRGRAAQTASKSVLWKCVTSYSYSLLEGFCPHSCGLRLPSRVHLPHGSHLCQPIFLLWGTGEEQLGRGWRTVQYRVEEKLKNEITDLVPSLPCLFMKLLTFNETFHRLV